MEEIANAQGPASGWSPAPAPPPHALAAAAGPRPCPAGPPPPPSFSLFLSPSSYLSLPWTGPAPCLPLELRQPPWRVAAGQIQPLRRRIRSPRLVPGLRVALRRRVPPEIESRRLFLLLVLSTGGRRAQRAALPGGPRRPCRPPPRIAQPRRPSEAPALAQPQPSRPGQRSRSSPSLCTDRAVAQEFRKRSECEDPFDYVGSSSSWTRSSSKRDLRSR